MGRVGPERTLGRRAAHAGIALGLGLLVVLLVQGAISDHDRSRDQFDLRYADRVQLSARNISASLSELQDRQEAFGEHLLGGDEVTAEEFDTAMLSFGYEAGVLLDAGGHVLQVTPRSDRLIGVDLAAKYAHLRAGVDGRRAVSDVVLSAALRTPIVAVAVPFPTPSGRRVMSGGYDLDSSPLSAFLEVTSTLRGRVAYLVDGAGQIVTSTEAITSGSFADAAPELARDGEATRRVTVDGERVLVVSTPVAGTDWHVVGAVPTASLYEPVPSNAPSWWLASLTGALGLAVLWLLRRTERQRDAVHALSRTDALTGLANRGHALEELERTAADATRRGEAWGIAMIDVDRFKQVNDRHGHATGDEVLRQVAQVLTAAARTSELVARWGGEEFLVVLRGTDPTGAAIAGHRFADAVRSAPPLRGIQVTVSVGTCSMHCAQVDLVVAEADRALYAAKTGGRDRVVAASAAPVGQSTGPTASSSSFIDSST